MIATASTQQTSSSRHHSRSSECYSIVHQYGSEFEQNQNEAARGPQGPPGKRGPTGLAGNPGLKGAQGSKGEKGECPDEMLEEIAELKQKYNELQERTPNKTCAHMRHLGLPSGPYLISPNPLLIAPFVVNCVFEEDRAYTVFPHNSEGEIYARKCKDAKCYSRDISYDHSMNQIRHVVAQSQKCRQYIKYRCKGSVFQWKGHVYASWTSYNGTEHTNWGGSEEPESCACSVTGTCRVQKYKCNCDENNNKITTFDDGYLNNKDDLPVTNLKFGDTDDQTEDGWHTLGRLECFGIAD